MFEPSVNETEQMTVACLAMRGAYAQIPEGYARLYHWVEAMRLRADGDAAGGVPHRSRGSARGRGRAWELWAPVQTGPSLERTGRPGTGRQSGRPPKAGDRRTQRPIRLRRGHVRERLAGWIAEQGYEIAGPPEEAYLTDPAETPPEEYLTEIALPVRVT